MDLVKEIERLKKEKNAIILAHFYQEKEIQEIADYLRSEERRVGKECYS